MNIRLIAFLLAVSLCAAMCGCAQTPVGPSAAASEPLSSQQTPSSDPGWKASLHIDESDLPVIDGALALAPYYEAAVAKLTDTDVERARTLVMCSNTPNAYKNLADGQVDMIFCAMPSDDQVKYAQSKGVEFEYHTFLSGGFVFFVNKDNPVDSLTIEQLQGIYSGKIKNWKELGGSNEPILPYQRNENSGSQTGLYRYVLPKSKVIKPITEHVIGEMGAVIDAVANYDNSKGAIGYSYYYYVASMHYTDQIKLLAVDGVVPSNDTIGSGEYPFLNKSQIVINADTPADSTVRSIIRWAQSDEGARLAEENGYVADRSQK